MTTAAGDIELQIPKLRAGSFFPSLLERRRQIDRTLFAVVMEAWVQDAQLVADLEDIVRDNPSLRFVQEGSVRRVALAL